MPAAPLRILADENVPMVIVRRLRADGHEVVAVVERHPSLPDLDVIERAVAEQAVLLTLDRDIGEHIFAGRVAPPVGVVYLRLFGVPPDEVPAVVSDLIATHASQLAGSFLTYRREATRIRPLPL